MRVIACGRRGFGAAGVGGVACIVAFVREIGDQIARNRHPCDESGFRGQVLCSGPLGRAYRGRYVLPGDVRVGGYASHSHAESAVLYPAVVAVADLAASVVREVGLAGGVDESRRRELVDAGMVGDPDRGEPVILARGAEYMTVQQDVHSSSAAQIIGRPFHALRVEHDSDGGEPGSLTAPVVRSSASSSSATPNTTWVAVSRV
jgi:hypothetical protein